MKKIALSLCVVLSLSAMASAGVLPKSPKLGCQRITEFPRARKATTPKGKVADPNQGEAKKTILKAKNWYCGRSFTDQDGRRWSLASGTPDDGKPAELAGWLIRDANGQLSFMTNQGSLFRLGHQAHSRLRDLVPSHGVVGPSCVRSRRCCEPGGVIRDVYRP